MFVADNSLCSAHVHILQVVQVCAEHKKPAKLLKHLEAIKAASQGLRNPPRVLVFANRIKVCAAAATAWSRIQVLVCSLE